MLRARTSEAPHIRTTDHPCRMLKQSFSKAAGESNPEAYPSDFDEPRTKSEERRVSARRGRVGENSDCFSILLTHILLKQIIPLLPFTMPAVGIDVPRLADINEHASPSHRTMFGMGK